MFIVYDIPVHLPICLLVYLSTHLHFPVYLFNDIPVYLTTWLLFYLSIQSPVYSFTRPVQLLNIFLPVFQIIRLICLNDCLFICVSTCLIVYLPTSYNCQLACNCLIEYSLLAELEFLFSALLANLQSIYFRFFSQLL